MMFQRGIQMPKKLKEKKFLPSSHTWGPKSLTFSDHFFYNFATLLVNIVKK